jgi:hypothetical protein
MAMDRDTDAIPWSDPIAHRAFVEERMRHIYPAGMGYWSILALEGLVGWILLSPSDLHGPEIEIGWWLMRKA